MRLPLLLAALALAAPASAATPIAGRWVTVEGDSIVTIGPCGGREAGRLCGRITTFLKRPPTANPVDGKNPDPALRGRPILGLAVLSGFTDQGKDWRGRIYDPRSGKSYKSILTRNGDGTLKVQGCVAFLCQTQVWRPVR